MKRTDKKSQAERFLEAAKEVGVDESGRKFDEAFRKIAKAKRAGRPKSA